MTLHELINGLLVYITNEENELFNRLPADGLAVERLSERETVLAASLSKKGLIDMKADGDGIICVPKRTDK